MSFKKQELRKISYTPYKKKHKPGTTYCPSTTRSAQFSDVTLEQPEEITLSKGFYFSITIKTIPTWTIISQVETATSHLPDE